MSEANQTNPYNQEVLPQLSQAQEADVAYWRDQTATMNIQTSRQPERHSSRPQGSAEQVLAMQRAEAARLFNGPSPRRAAEQARREADRARAGQQARVDGAQNEVARTYSSERIKNEIVGRYTDSSLMEIGGRGAFTNKRGDKFHDPEMKAVGFVRYARDVLPGQITPLREARKATDVPVETVVFKDVEDPVYRDAVVAPAVEATWRKAARPAQTRREQVGTQRAYGINQETGRQEPLSSVTYTFHIPSSERGIADLPGMPQYRETGGTRFGNMLQVQIQLPESVAGRLRGELATNPDAIRDIADGMVLKAFADDPKKMDPGLWFNYGNRREPNGQGTSGRGRPPYEYLPEGWQLHIIEPARPGQQSLGTDRGGSEEFADMRHIAVAAPAQRSH